MPRNLTTDNLAFCDKSFLFLNQSNSVIPRNYFASDGHKLAMEVQKSDDSLERLYPDILEAGGLDKALAPEFARLNSGLKAETERSEFGPYYTRVENGQRFSQIYVGAKERAFSTDFWLRGVCMAHCHTKSVADLALVLHSWNAEQLRIAQMVQRFTNFHVTEGNAIAFEEGTEIESVWDTYRQSTSDEPISEIVQLASRHEKLGQLFPYRSLSRLGFSRTTGFPYTFDLPLIAARDGEFIVQDYAGIEIKRTSVAQEAIDLVASMLPPYCKRAISGTCEDLPEDDPWYEKRETSST